MQGLKVGNYKITSTIGEGGMGAVYRAVHESLGRSVAVKVLLPEISSSRDMVTRFFNEARAAASVQHSGIVDAYDFGFLPDGRAYIIMEFLEGESLGSRLRRLGRMPQTRALQLVRSIARALHAAHERGIVHRDIKPDNIFLVPDAEVPMGERVKLLDFGIAKLGGDDAEIGLTKTGAVMGTPTYMAPEQCRGAGTVDRRADLYALGCILYEMLCGRPPFVAEGAGDVIAHQMYFPPPPPRSLNASIVPALEALVLALLQKDPAHRPSTAHALVEAIDRLDVPVDCAPVQLGEPTPAVASPLVTTLRGAVTSINNTSAGSASRIRRVLVATGAIAAVAGVAGVVVFFDPGEGSKAGLAPTAQIGGISERLPVAAGALPAPPPVAAMTTVLVPTTVTVPVPTTVTVPAPPPLAAVAVPAPSSLPADRVIAGARRSAAPAVTVPTGAVLPAAMSPVTVPTVTAPAVATPAMAVPTEASPPDLEASAVVELYGTIGRLLKRLEETRGQQATSELWPRYRLLHILEVVRTREGRSNAYDTLRNLEHEIELRSQ